MPALPARFRSPHPDNERAFELFLKSGVVPLGGFTVESNYPTTLDFIDADNVGRGGGRGLGVNYSSFYVICHEIRAPES